MHIDFADKSTSKSISPKVSKYQFDTLNCSLEELAVLERVAQNPNIKQQELVSATGKSIATVKRIITSLQDKNYTAERTARDTASGKCGLIRNPLGSSLLNEIEPALANTLANWTILY